MIQPTASYSSTEDNSHPVAMNTDFSHIRTPNYCDEDELLGNGVPSRNKIRKGIHYFFSLKIMPLRKKIIIKMRQASEHFLSAKN